MDGLVSAEVLVEQAPDAMILADRDGLIRFWNAAAERVFGHAAEDAIGKSLDIIIPERFREAHWLGYERAMAAGDTKYRGRALPTRSERNGEPIYVELSFAIVRDERGEVAGALCQARDITERFFEERALRARLRELEASSQPAEA